MTEESKLKNLENMLAFAKQNKLKDSLISSLLHTALKLSIRLDDYREDLFKEYLDIPLELNNDQINAAAINYRNKPGNKHKWSQCI